MHISKHIFGIKQWADNLFIFVCNNLYCLQQIFQTPVKWLQ